MSLSNMQQYLSKSYMRKNTDTFWEPGDKAKIGQIVGLSIVMISGFTTRLRTVGKERALMLEAATRAIGKEVPFIDWIFNEYTDHPAFSGKPKPFSRKMDDAVKFLRRINK